MPFENNADPAFASDLRRIAGEKHGRRLLLTSSARLRRELAGGKNPQAEWTVSDCAAYAKTPAPKQKFVLGIVACERSGPAFDNLLSRLRDCDCERVCLCCNNISTMADDEHVRALGFQLLKTYPRAPGGAPGGRLYYFDIFDYKDTPNWLNSRNWANPEMWGKARW